MVSRGSGNLGVGDPSPDDRIEALGSQLDAALAAIAVLAGQLARQAARRRELEEVIDDIASAGEVMAADLSAEKERLNTVVQALRRLAQEGRL